MRIARFIKLSCLKTFRFIWTDLCRCVCSISCRLTLLSSFSLTGMSWGSCSPSHSRWRTTCSLWRRSWQRGWWGWWRRQRRLREDLLVSVRPAWRPCKRRHSTALSTATWMSPWSCTRWVKPWCSTCFTNVPSWGLISLMDWIIPVYFFIFMDSQYGMTIVDIQFSCYMTCITIYNFSV